MYRPRATITTLLKNGMRHSPLSSTLSLLLILIVVTFILQSQKDADEL